MHGVNSDNAQAAPEELAKCKQMLVAMSKRFVWFAYEFKQAIACLINVSSYEQT